MRDEEEEDDFLEEDAIENYDGIDREILECITLKGDIGAKMSHIIKFCNKYEEELIKETLGRLVRDKTLHTYRQVYFLGEL